MCLFLKKHRSRFSLGIWASKPIQALNYTLNKSCEKNNILVPKQVLNLYHAQNCANPNPQL